MSLHHEPDRAPGAAGARLRGWRAVESHWRAAGRRPRYRRLLARFGVDPDACEALGTADHPRLMYAEQAGCWLMLRDRARVAFTRRLAARLGAPDRWRVCALGADAMSDGAKSVLVEVWLHPGFGRLRLLPSMVMRRHRRTSYRALPLDGRPRQRLRDAFAGMGRLGAAIARGPGAFAATMAEGLRAGAAPGLRSLLPRENRPAALRRLGQALSDIDARALVELADHGARQAAEAPGWAELWAAINGRFLGAPVRALDPLFDRFVGCIVDPDRAGRALAGLQPDPTRGVPLVGIIDPGDRYRIVYWTPDGLFWRSKGERRPIEWSAVQALAAEGRSGGPAGVLEYLMLAATGRYLVVDTCDPVARFQRVAADVHRRWLDLDFPCVAFDMADAADGHPPDGAWLLDALHPTAELRIERAVQCSMAGMAGATP